MVVLVVVGFLGVDLLPYVVCVSVIVGVGIMGVVARIALGRCVVLVVACWYCCC